MIRPLAVMMAGTVLAAPLFGQESEFRQLDRLLAELDGDDLVRREEAQKELIALVGSNRQAYGDTEAARAKAATEELKRRLDVVLREGDYPWARKVRVVAAPPIAPQGGGRSSDLAVSPDGRFLLSRGEDGRIVRLNPEDLREIGVLEDVGPLGDAWAFSPDSRRLAVGGARSIGIFELSTGRRVDRLPRDPAGGDAREPWALAFSPDGATLYSGSKEGLSIWNVGTGTLVKTLRPPAPPDTEGRLHPDLENHGINAIAVAADGSFVVTQC